DGVLRLQRGDRVDGVRAPDGLGRRLAQAKVLYLAGLHQLGHRADRLLDLDVGIHAVLVVEVDLVDAQALQGPVDRLPDVLGGAVDPTARRPPRGARGVP